MTRVVRAVRERLAREAGHTLPELLTVMAILSVVMGGLTTVFVQGSNAQNDMNKRFQAQLDARVALDRIRREVHCASSITPAAVQTTSVTLTLPSQCKNGTGNVTWCTRATGATWTLYRVVGIDCVGGIAWAANFTNDDVFYFHAQSTTSLAKLSVDFPVNLEPTKTYKEYRLQDSIVLRNSTRT